MRGMMKNHHVRDHSDVLITYDDGNDKMYRDIEAIEDSRILMYIALIHRDGTITLLRDVKSIVYLKP